MKYPEFKNIIETMKEHRYDFEADIKRVQNTANLRKNGEKFPLYILTNKLLSFIALSRTKIAAINSKFRPQARRFRGRLYRQALIFRFRQKAYQYLPAEGL